MKRLIENVFSVLLLMFTAVFGTMVTVWSFTQIFATSQLTWWAAVLAAACGACVCISLKLMGKAGSIARIAIFAALIVLVVNKFDAIAGGFSYIFNYLIDAVNYYYKSGVYYILLTDAMLEKGNQELVVLILCALAGWCYMSVLINRRGVLFVSLVSLLCYFIPASLEAAPTVFTLVGMLCFIVCVVVHSNLPREKNELRARRSGILAMLWIILPSALIVFGASKLLPKKDFSSPDFYDKIAGRVVFSVKDIQDILQNNYGKKVQNDIPGTAHGELGKVDRVEYKDVPILYVRAPKNGGTLYLKDFQAAEYTKRRWKELDASVYRKYSAMFDALREEGNSPLLMGYRAVSELTGMNAEGIGSAEFDVMVKKYDNSDGSYIPMSALYIDGSSVEKMADTDMNITLADDVSGAKNVQHRYSVFEWRNFSSLDKLIESGASLALDDGGYRDFVYENYLGTNTTCADRIRDELLPEIMKENYDISSPAGKAQLIMDTISFFATDYSYTLSPGSTPSSKDYVEYFLFETKRGLCVHFASAATMIFRCAGIPARYVEGYVVPESLFTQEADYRKQAELHRDGDWKKEMWQYYDIEVTDRYAHAWVEVYMDGIGWITVDPTPGYAAQYVSSQEWYDGVRQGQTEDGSENGINDITDDNTSDNNIDDMENTTDRESVTDNDSTSEASGTQTDGSQGGKYDNEIAVDNGLSDDSKPGSANQGGTMARNESGGENTVSDDENSSHFSLSQLAGKVYNILKPALHIMLIVLKIIAIPAVLVLFLVIRQKYMEQARTRLYNSTCGLYTSERIEKIMAYFEKLLKAAGIRIDCSMDFTDLICSYPVDGIDTKKAAQIVENTLFSGTFPGEDDTMFIMAYVSEVRKSIYSRKNIFGKFYFKYILAL